MPRPSTAHRAREAAEHRLRTVLRQWRPSDVHDPNVMDGVHTLLDAEEEQPAHLSVGPWSRPALRGLVLLLAVVAVVVGYLLWQAQPRDIVVAPVDPIARSDADPGIAPQVLATGAPLTGAAADEPVPEPSVPGPDMAPAETEIVVHVTGLVRRPGLVRVPQGARVADAIALAGGVTRRRAEGSVNLARVVVDGEQIVVGDPVAPGPAGSSVASANAATGAVPTPVDLNTASPEQLDALPGVGPVLAGRIVQWRSTHGPFRSIEELGEVSGIGDAILTQLRPLVRV